MISFTIPGDPVPFARAGSNGSQRFTPAKQRTAMNAVRNYAIKAKGRRSMFAANMPLQIEITASWAYPKSWNAGQRVPSWRTARPDADNISKLICDAINGIIYADDAQLALITVSKVYGSESFTSVNVSPLSEVEVTE